MIIQLCQASPNHCPRNPAISQLILGVMVGPTSNVCRRPESIWYMYQRCPRCTRQRKTVGLSFTTNGFLTCNVLRSCLYFGENCEKYGWKKLKTVSESVLIRPKLHFLKVLDMQSFFIYLPLLYNAKHTALVLFKPKIAILPLLLHLLRTNSWREHTSLT